MSTLTNPLTPTFDAHFSVGRYWVHLSTGEVLTGSDLAHLGRRVAVLTYGAKRWAHATSDSRDRWAGHEAALIAARCARTH